MNKKETTVTVTLTATVIIDERDADTVISRGLHERIAAALKERLDGPVFPDDVTIGRVQVFDTGRAE